MFTPLWLSINLRDFRVEGLSPGLVLPAHQINTVEIFRSIGAKDDMGGHVSHGVAAASLGGMVRKGAMDGEGVVEMTLAGIEFEIDRTGFVDLRPVDFCVEHIRLSIDLGVPKPLGPTLMRSRNDPHAAVFAGGGIDSHPQGDDLHRGDAVSPVIGVGVPRNREAVPLRFGNEVARPEGDVGTDEGFDDIEHPGMGQKSEEFRVLEMRDIKVFGANSRRHLGEDVFEAGAEVGELFGGEDAAEFQVSLTAIEIDLFGGREQGGGRRRLVHEAEIPR